MTAWCGTGSPAARVADVEVRPAAVKGARGFSVEP
jgi:hypothetical protein